MARIPKAELERIKHAVRLTDLARSSGVTLTRHGSQLRGRCPFHPDKTPSLVITPEKNLWNCLGACAAGGSPIDWVMRTRNVSFRHAAEILRAQADGESLDAPADTAATTASLPPVITDPDATDAELLEQVTTYYHETLLAAPPARDYLTRRGLASEDLIRHFRLGFADRTLTYRLARKHRDILRKRLTALGIFRQKSGHEHLNGCITVPVFDADGQVAELYGRRISTRLRPGTPQHLYLPGPHRGVFNRSGLEEIAGGQEDLILCEALVDALTFWVAGFKNVTASFGINGFTDELRATLLDSGARRILIAYDNDTAGNRAAESLAKDLRAAGLDTYRIHFPAGMDANSFASKVTPASKSLGLLLRQAQFLTKGTAPAAATPTATEAEPPHEAGEAGEARRTSRVAKEPPEAPGPTDATGSSTAAQPAGPAELLPPLAAPASTARGSGSEREAVDGKTAAKERNRGDIGGEGRPLESPPPLPAAAPAVGDRPSGPDASKTATDASPAPLSASPEPPAPRIAVTPIITDTEVVLPIADRHWRIRGLEKNTTLEHLRVNCQVTSGPRFHVDTLDLMCARPRLAFLALAAHELDCPQELLAEDLRTVLFELDKLQATRAAGRAFGAAAGDAGPAELEEDLGELENDPQRLEEPDELQDLDGEDPDR